jgi:WD40 repeat protein
MVILALLFLMVVLQPAAFAGDFVTGDVLVALTDGSIQVRTANGTLKSTLVGPIQAPAKGMTFDPEGNLLVTYWYSQGWTSGNTVLKFRPDGSYAGTYGSSYNCNPTGIVTGKGKNGFVYVGQADCGGDIMKIDVQGNVVDVFDVAIENYGARWIDLAPDGCTIYYTSAGKNVYRYDVCGGTQLPNFNAAPLTETDADGLGLRVMPDGGMIVSATYDIRRLDASGNQVALYDAAGDNGFAAVSLDPDGTSFWSSSYQTSSVYKFDIATGQILMSFNSGVQGAGAKGVFVVPEFPGCMRGDGAFRASDGTTARHSFHLDCHEHHEDTGLQITWGRDSSFDLATVTSVACYDDSRIEPEGRSARLNTIMMTGTGTYNGVAGATISAVFTDAGTRGQNDGVQITIKDAQGNVVFHAGPTTLIQGNHLALGHPRL